MKKVSYTEAVAASGDLWPPAQAVYRLISVIHNIFGTANRLLGQPHAAKRLQHEVQTNISTNIHCKLELLRTLPSA